MEIYIKSVDKDFGDIAWYNDDGMQSYWQASPTLEVAGAYDDYYAGTPFKTPKVAVQAAREGKKLAAHDGYDVDISFWMFRGGKLVEVKIVKDKVTKNFRVVPVK